MALFLHVYLLLLFLQSCYSVGVDYIVDTNIEESQDVNARRAGNAPISSKHLCTQTTTKKPVDDYNYIEDDDDGEFKIHLPTRRTRPAKLTTELFSVTTNKTTVTKVIETTSHILSSNSTASFFFKELDYQSYDEVTSALRQEFKNFSLENIQNNEDEIETISEDNTTEIIFNEFYSHEPAGVVLNYREPAPITKNISTWYVPEKYPCWDLLLLYGELGRKRTTEEVFLISPVKLKRVIDNDNAQPINFDTDTVGNLDNKWCFVPPCYGDHVLCLYPHKINSKICDEKYIVSAPTMLEQVALVNTLNSMRNHVARGTPNLYPYLPPAANMRQVLYDYDLERMSKAWLRQCLPGPASCSALDSTYVFQLECTRYAENCCPGRETKCVPRSECFIHPIIGCIHTWFWDAGDDLEEIDIRCGYIEPTTYSTVQLLWANTNKIGCAYGRRHNGDVRVVCNFAPGAPYILNTKYFCGVLAHKDITSSLADATDILNASFLSSLGIELDRIPNKSKRNYVNRSEIIAANHKNWFDNVTNDLGKWGVMSLAQIYSEGWVRSKIEDKSNGTKGLIARLVTRYKFIEETRARCDTDEPIYSIGEPGSECMEKGRKFYALCYEFRDPTPGYRMVAVVAPVALFSLILYDLFSGVVRQANY